MAKKVVATLSKGNAKKLAKLVYAKKSEKTGAYAFKESIVTKDKVNDFFAEK